MLTNKHWTFRSSFMICKKLNLDKIGLKPSSIRPAFLAQAAQLLRHEHANIQRLKPMKLLRGVITNRCSHFTKICTSFNPIGTINRFLDYLH